jgi:hypothetical protein
MQWPRSAKRLSPASVGELRGCDHLLQIYGRDERLLEVLEWFVGQGLRDNGAVILIATPRHLHELEIRLRAQWVPIDKARWQSRYIAMVASEVLEKILVNGWPDETGFNALIDERVGEMRKKWPSVRAFEEMVGILMERGQKEAAVRLEQIWSAYCAREGLPVLCAYHEPVFTKGAVDTMHAIAAQHSRVLAEQD